MNDEIVKKLRAAEWALPQLEQLERHAKAQTEVWSQHVRDCVAEIESCKRLLNTERQRAQR